MSDALYILLAYLLGSIPFGLLAGKLKGVDIRKHGSGNIGTTNVFRVCGKGLGIPVFILDVLKGLVPVLLAKSHTMGAIPIFCAVAAILGHNFPIWLKFKGGKGIATSAGALGGLLPWALLVALITWILTFAISRYVSLASIFAAISLPITVALQAFGSGSTRGWPEIVFTLVIAGLAVWRHRGNIARLRAGTEHRFSRKASTKS